MDDLISRQAAIDDIKAMYEWHDVVTEDRLIEHIKRLPSAQPTVLNAKKVCEFWNSESNFCALNRPSAQPENLQQTCNQLATDCVSRQAAINAAKEELDNGTFYDIPSKIESLPSAQPEIAENLYMCKCYITDKDGLQHEVIHTDDIRRVTGWEI